MIVVTGASGHVGRLVSEGLAGLGEPMRLLSRDPARAPELPGATAAFADYGDPASLADVLDAGDAVFMVSLHEGPESRVPLHRSLIEAAAHRRVAHVVYLSFVNAGPGATFLHARSHGATEELLERSGVPWTSMRNGMYADAIPGWFDAEGVNRVPGGGGRMSFSYRPELADAIVVALTEPGHQGQVYDITTPDAVTMAELAAIASAVTGDSYRAEPRTDAEWEAGWRSRGRRQWQIEAGLTSYAALRNGELDVISDDYRALTGRNPLTIADVIRRHADEMPLSRGGSA